MIKIFIILLSTLTLLPIGSFAQSSEFCIGKTVLFEADYVGAGMSGIQGNHLIAKICEDRTVQFEDVRQTKAGVEYVLRERKLSRVHYEKVRDYLDNPEAKKLDEKYPAFTSTLDHSEDLIMTIFVDGAKRITVSNFKPDIPAVSVKYPLGLLKLGCLANWVRGKSELVFFFRESAICNDLI